VNHAAESVTTPFSQGGEQLRRYHPFPQIHRQRLDLYPPTALASKYRESEISNLENPSPIQQRRKPV
jgi:hypothetical protein